MLYACPGTQVRGDEAMSVALPSSRPGMKSRALEEMESCQPLNAFLVSMSVGRSVVAWVAQLGVKVTLNSPEADGHSALGLKLENKWSAERETVALVVRM